MTSQNETILLYNTGKSNEEFMIAISDKMPLPLYVKSVKNGKVKTLAQLTSYER
tara:strand:+ start:2814 stop:2975 length:162 start_codon:yes stop_codon:yes gene_type:complete